MHEKTNNLHMLKQRCRSAVQYLIIIISIFIEDDNVFSTAASVPYGPLVNTDIDYFRTFFVIVRTFSYKTCDVSDAIFCFWEKPVLALYC